MTPEQEIALLEQLIDEMLAGIQDTLQSGEILSDEFQAAIAAELEATTNRIDELRAQNPVESLPPTQPQEPDLHQSMPSSNVESFGYDPKSERLLVRFLGKYPQRNGEIYSYEGVPKVIFDLFKSGAVPARTDGKNKWGTWWRGKSPSIGASLYTLIKTQGYPYQKLS